MSTSLQALDWLVIFIYLTLLIGFAWRLSRHQ